MKFKPRKIYNTVKFKLIIFFHLLSGCFHSHLSIVSNSLILSIYPLSSTILQRSCNYLPNQDTFESKEKIINNHIRRTGVNNSPSNPGHHGQDFPLLLKDIGHMSFLWQIIIWLLPHPDNICTSIVSLTQIWEFQASFVVRQGTILDIKGYP